MCQGSEREIPELGGYQDGGISARNKIDKGIVIDVIQDQEAALICAEVPELLGDFREVAFQFEAEQAGEFGCGGGESALAGHPVDGGEIGLMFVREFQGHGGFATAGQFADRDQRARFAEALAKFGEFGLAAHEQGWARGQVFDARWRYGATGEQEGAEFEEAIGMVRTEIDVVQGPQKWRDVAVAVQEGDEFVLGEGVSPFLIDPPRLHGIRGENEGDEV